MTEWRWRNEDIMTRPLEEVVRHLSQQASPDLAVTTHRTALLQARVVYEAAKMQDESTRLIQKATDRLATWTVWLVVATAALAMATVALVIATVAQR